MMYQIGSIGRYLQLIVLIFLMLSCSNNDPEDEPIQQQVFGIFEVIDDVTVEVDGEIEDSSLDDFNELISDYPDIERINIAEVPGSLNDEINLALSSKVYQQNIDMHLLDNGEIASGGVDFFLAGRSRSIGSNTRIGVHSWSDGTNEASDFPEGDPVHQPYINYYISVGFSQEEAEDFYYFTINAASAEDIHWMTEDEIARYKILK